MKEKSIITQRGITLIALVITMIIMLILIAVTLKLAIEGGLFNYAKRAAQEMEQKQQAEQNWVALTGNLSKDQLIEKYTGESQDLALLRKYFVGKLDSELRELVTLQAFPAPIDVYLGSFKDNTIIPDASQTVQEVSGGDNEVIIEYHNNLYRVKQEYQGDNANRYTEVEELTETEKIIFNGDYIIGSFIGEEDIRFYQYNNKIYKLRNEQIVETIDPPTDDVVVFAFGQYIRFTPQIAQTWITWATAENDLNDLSLNNLQENLTLKKLITYRNGQEDKTVMYTEGSNINLGNLFRNPEYKVMLVAKMSAGGGR